MKVNVTKNNPDGKHRELKFSIDLPYFPMPHHSFIVGEFMYYVLYSRFDTGTGEAHVFCSVGSGAPDKF